ncbi:hypothetical protein COO60DRAFT_709101 [Scenedesmus sp. NREL 46B-D3]|nr:hypothetical protein COO60DRAFT_709101 [Scenedesmus sp. NREL 46B-D3]
MLLLPPAVIPCSLLLAVVLPPCPCAGPTNPAYGAYQQHKAGLQLCLQKHCRTEAQQKRHGSGVRLVAQLRSVDGVPGSSTRLQELCGGRHSTGMRAGQVSRNSR